MTTPAQDAPLVFPSVAFRPIRLLVICAALSAVAVAAAALLGHVMISVFFAVGLLLGLLNAILVRRSVEAITAGAHPLKRKMALNSATRLLVMTVIGLTIAFIFRPAGLGAVFGMAFFQVLLVLTTALPVWKAIRTHGGQERWGHLPPEGQRDDRGITQTPADGTEGTAHSDD